MRLDTQRVNDLSNIQWQIINYWQQKGEIPDNLILLNDSISGFKIPSDPKTSTPYIYEKTGAVSFKICANFDLPSEDNSGRGEYGGGAIGSRISMPIPAGGDNWTHDKGNVCFDRVIDPTRYPVIKK